MGSSDFLAPTQDPLSQCRPGGDELVEFVRFGEEEACKSTFRFNLRAKEGTKPVDQGRKRCATKRMEILVESRSIKRDNHH